MVLLRKMTCSPPEIVINVRHKLLRPLKIAERTSSPSAVGVMKIESNFWEQEMWIEDHRRSFALKE
ncbi:hypothetical protein F511_20828 [Dorcoceras hygrometricum]|uniref:Uncharacterized protein n=1 Tax=Dorcoceras hygrometricum TaxID=472368 RepID=A0A2Z7A6B4_9LAMI|nr:hypothetical protein F511_20828 [Dorcoceras hygrometricum]